MVNTDLQNQNNSRKFNLILCELFNSHVHGSNNNEIEQIDGHYLLIDVFDGLSGTLLEDYDEFYEDYTDNESDSDTDTDNDDSENSNNSTSIAAFSSDYNKYYHQIQNINLSKPHKIIRNYKNIIARLDYIKPEIAECFVLPSQHSIVIIKTIWIKIIQRKWRKIYAEQKNILKKRMQYSSLKTREITGKWPAHCCHFPTIHGMLSNLNNNTIYFYHDLYLSKF